MVYSDLNFEVSLFTWRLSMPHRKTNVDPDDPKPLNFDHDEEKGVSDHLKKPYLTPEDERGDTEDDQYYEEEEALSPEEVKKRKQEDDLTS
jgi:hypothetical protein